MDYRHVLTAAHCCFDKENKLRPSQIMSIAAGNLNISIGRSYPTIVKNVQTIIVHSMYKASDIVHDIAVLKVGLKLQRMYLMMEACVLDFWKFSALD